MSFPFFGEEFTFTQPDGTRLPVRGWGDQHWAVFETLGGFTVVRDPITGFYQYATVTPDGEEFRPTGVQPGAADPENLGLQPRLRVSRAAARAQAELGVGLPKPRWEIRRERTKVALQATMTAKAALQDTMMAADIVPAPPYRQIVGDYVGLCLLVQFPDVPGTITQQQVERFCNQQGYTGFGNRGSVYDYFLDNSTGKLRYTTVVAPYYTAQHLRDYYTNPAIRYGNRARELIREALAYHVAKGFDFSGLTVDDKDLVYATNVFYAGRRVNKWVKGLWSHTSQLLTPVPLVQGRRAFDYQITDMDEALTLGTYCHENGHMLCDFPDLYDKGLPGGMSSGVGVYCLMGAGGNADRRNPTHVCAYLKYRAGWAESVTRITPGLTATATAGNNTFFLHEKSPAEYFIIENRFKARRDQALTDSGLAIWHVDELGDNSNEQMTPASHYECSLVQADGRNDLEEVPEEESDDRDLFHAGWRDQFADSTLPASKWWDGTSSGLDVHNIGTAGAQITFSANV
jgi:M6 family metalloprotease-like protein